MIVHELAPPRAVHPENGDGRRGREQTELDFGSTPLLLKMISVGHVATGEDNHAVCRQEVLRHDLERQ